jgi:hypothetical protein
MLLIVACGLHFNGVSQHITHGWVTFDKTVASNPVEEPPNG